ncbi:MAG: type II secretion system F family protein [Candidatus Aenigmarchaeota archaeon]|nr:type II secretion system F family protein [Candidatus Aenigmarchaeota archaeon]
MYKKMVRRFSRFGLKYFSNYMSPLKEEIKQSDIGTVYEIYVGKMFFFSLISSILIFIYAIAIFTLIGRFSLLISSVSGLLMAVISFFAILTIFHSYPFHLSANKKLSIDSNLPFAMNHAAAIAASGAPPSVLFRLLMAVPEYGQISKESGKIIRNITVFGMDTVSAIRDVADRTPSTEFRQYLYGIISTIETGGDLKSYLEGTAKDALFAYELKRERFLNTLTTYADFYTSVLIAAPLFFVSILSMMSLVGGQVLGMDITTAMRLGIYLVIPLLNIGFILFVHYTQPSV